MSDRWAERDRRREEHERWMAERRRANRNHHVAVVEEALRGSTSDALAREMAETAIDTLLAAGVVFAYLNTEPDPASAPQEDEPR